MAIVLPPLAWIVPWVGLAIWWVALSRACRRWQWVRSTPICVGLVVATLFADASVVVASARMSTPGGHEFAALILWIAGFLSITAFTILRTPRSRRDDDGGLGVTPEVPEPPWWPEFERDFRDYTQQPHTRPRPKPRVRA